MSNTGLLTMEPVRPVLTDPFFPRLAAVPAPPLWAPAGNCSIKSNFLKMKAVGSEILDLPFLPPAAAPPLPPTTGNSSIVVEKNGLLTMRAVGSEIWDLPFLPPAPPPSRLPTPTPSRPSLREMLPGRKSLIIHVLWYGVDVCFISDLMPLLSAVLSTFGWVTRKIKKAFFCLKDGICARIKTTLLPAVLRTFGSMARKIKATPYCLKDWIFVRTRMTLLPPVLFTFGCMTWMFKAAFTCLKDWIFVKMKKTLLSTVLFTFSSMAWMIKAAFTCVKDLIFVKMKETLLSTVFTTFGSMARKLKTAFTYFKVWIFVKMKMIKWPPPRPHLSHPAGNLDNDGAPDIKEAKEPPKETNVTIIFPTPRCKMKSPPKADRVEDEEEPNQDVKEEHNALPQDTQEKGNSEKADSDDTSEVLVFKVKNGLMGRLIGKKGSHVKTMKRDLKLCIMYGSLEQGHSFFRLEGPISAVNTAKTLCCERVKTGMEEIDPTDIAHRVPRERIISIEYKYNRRHHGRVVGREARCLKDLKAIGVAVVITPVRELNHMEITGNAANIREAQLWIMANLNTALFVTIPELIEAPEAQPEDTLAENIEGALASAGAGFE